MSEESDTSSDDSLTSCAGRLWALAVHACRMRTTQPASPKSDRDVPPRHATRFSKLPEHRTALVRQQFLHLGPGPARRMVPGRCIGFEPPSDSDSPAKQTKKTNACSNPLDCWQSFARRLLFVIILQTVVNLRDPRP